MIDVGRIQGSAAMAVPLIVGLTTVYEHKNIVQITEDQDGNPVDNLYEYDEVQYGVGEYIELQSQRNDDLESMVDDLLTNVLPSMAGGE